MFGRPATPATRVTGAAILLAVGFWVSTGTAAASCGDYVIIDGQPAAHGTNPTGHPASPGRPCHGPNCTAAPAPAPVPMTAPPPVEPGAKEVAARVADETADVHSDCGRASLDADGRPISRPSSPYHPPRPF